LDLGSPHDHVDHDVVERPAVETAVDARSPDRPHRAVDAHRPELVEPELEEVALGVGEKDVHQRLSDVGVGAVGVPRGEVDVLRRSCPVGHADFDRGAAFKDPPLAVGQGEPDEKSFEGPSDGAGRCPSRRYWLR